MALTGFIGQNYGAHRMDRVKEGMKESVITLSAFTVAAGGIPMAAAPVILRLFTTDPEILANGRQAILSAFSRFISCIPSIRSTSAG
ncbi:MAG: MATE family efflux transporter [Lachnospiraceae bacterium]